jgi:hypothetical protein
VYAKRRKSPCLGLSFFELISRFLGLESQPEYRVIAVQYRRDVRIIQWFSETFETPMMAAKRADGFLFPTPIFPSNETPYKVPFSKTDFALDSRGQDDNRRDSFRRAIWSGPKLQIFPFPWVSWQTD